MKSLSDAIVIVMGRELLTLLLLNKPNQNHLLLGASTELTVASATHLELHLEAVSVVSSISAQ